jgi:hypothetical protein
VSWRLRIWCEDCSFGQDPQGCFDGGESTSDEVFQSKEDAESWGYREISGPWWFESIDGPEARAGELAHLEPYCQRPCLGRTHSFKEGRVCTDKQCDPACIPCDKLAQWYQLGSESALFCDDHRRPDYEKLYASKAAQPPPSQPTGTGRTRE